MSKEEQKLSKDELSAKLKARLGEKRIDRSTKKAKENTVKQSIEEAGLDFDKFKKALETVKKAGGFSMNTQDYLEKNK